MLAQMRGRKKRSIGINKRMFYPFLGNRSEELRPELCVRIDVLSLNLSACVALLVGMCFHVISLQHLT